MYKKFCCVFILLLLIIPNMTAQTTQIKGFWHTVKWGETISAIAKKYSVNPHLLAGVNNIDNWNYIFAGEALWIPLENVQKYSTYTVKANEHLLAIAEKTGVSVWIIAKINGIFNLDVIYPGQELIIPFQ